ncbi:AzlD domain-containing protein [Phaeobacter italicus]|jgi:branched-subunit amino acid transport protein|uniref:Putative membrane protein n=2 Tax=Phaeobacter italicus TaxID=481446 RepID=A0A0H5CZD4_9RHOB|nr:AzlD domain-containing protein [Phaeobacter italicus]CRL10184.1 putative membrane protein [Phaeobacter italicus]
MTQAPDPTLLWTIIIGLAVGSFALRFAFIGLMGGRTMPAWLMRHLRYTAVAIIPALVAPLVAWPTPTGGAPSLPHVAVAVAVFALGYLTRNVLIAMGAGACGFLLLFLLH